MLTVIVVLLAAMPPSTPEERQGCESDFAQIESHRDDPAALAQWEEAATRCVLDHREAKAHADAEAAADAARKAKKAALLANVEGVAARVSAHAADPLWWRAALSVRRCELVAKRDAAQASIAQEKALAKVGGVVNLAVIHDAEAEIVDARGLLASTDSLLRDLKAKPLACEDPSIQLALTCVVEMNINDDCTGDAGDVARFLERLPEFEFPAPAATPSKPTKKPKPQKP